MMLRSVIPITKRLLSTSAEHDLLHHAILPTDYFQSSLPRLAVPKLEETLSRYLSSQRPLLDDADFDRTSNIVAQFGKSEGLQLQKALVSFDKANRHSSFVSDVWFDMYLRDRRSVVLNHNPFMAFNPCTNSEYNQVDVRATNMIYSSLRFYKAYKKGVLRPDVFHLNPSKTENEAFERRLKLVPRRLAWYVAAFLYKAYALDMSQFPNLFASTRVPQQEKDSLERFPDSKHLVVMKNGNFYAFDVLSGDGQAVAPEIILGHIQTILHDDRKPAEFPLGVLTGDKRSSWCDFRGKLLALADINRKSLEKIDSALFVICLDSEEPEDIRSSCRSFLHSDGHNRWFDKSFSLIFTPKGQAAVNFEHSWGDGVAVLRYFNEVYKDVNTKPVVSPTSQPKASDATVEHLDFVFNDALKAGISNSLEDFKKRTSDLTLDFARLSGIGKSVVKSSKLSPDAFVQLAIQLAYFKLSGGQTAPTYESCSTAAFRKGRTETIRSCTSESKAFCQLVSSADSDVASLVEALKKSCEKHSHLTKEAAMGKGWDRHLLVLRKFSEKENMKSEIFSDPAYTNINSIVLSTSTLTSPAVLIGGFAPVTHAGFGVGYGIDDNEMGCVVTTYPSSGRSSKQFVDAFQEACGDLKAVLEGRHPRL